jgi:hypothetical protein
MIPGTIAWNDSGNNKAYIAGDTGLTFKWVFNLLCAEELARSEAAGDGEGYHAPEGAEGYGQKLADELLRA